MFQVGQKVRLLHGEGEGVILEVLSPKQYLVNIDDFPEEFEHEELVNVSEEEIHIHPSTTFVDLPGGPESKAPVVTLFECPLIIFEKISQEECKIHLLNQTPYTVLFSAFERRKGKSIGLHHGQIQPGASCLIHQNTQTELEFIKKLEFQIIRVGDEKGFSRKDIIEKQVPVLEKIKTQTWGKYSGFDGEVLAVPIIEFAPQTTEVKTPSFVAKAEVVDLKNIDLHAEGETDLHIEALFSEDPGMTPYQSLEYQLRRFEKQLEMNIAAELKSWIVIHGTGTNKLQREIYKKLKACQEVLSWKQAEISKYGLGATEITFF